MTASDSHLNTIQLHELIDKTEITEEEINLMHTLVEKQGGVIEKLWFTILSLDEIIQKQKEKHGEKDSFVKLIRVIRDQFLKSIGAPNYFHS